MTHLELRHKFLEFWKEKPRNHVEIPSSSLVPENDPTTLFTGSGMQPLIPYLLGQLHPLGERLVNIQKCFRGQDVDGVGDNRHDTFFEMMGNWSLGDYFKKEQLSWYWEFLKEIFGGRIDKLHVTCFEGYKNIPRDTESAKIWKSLGIPEERIHFYGTADNWWSRSGEPEKMPVGEIGGPDSEVFYEFDIPHDRKYGEQCHPNCECGKFLEIGNSVFIQYQKQKDGSFTELPQKNVDFGGGMERTLATLNNDPDIFKTDLFLPIIKQLEERLGVTYDSNDEITKSLRIIADHLKASAFLIASGIIPSNKQQGYVLRRLLRRSALKAFDIKREFDSQDFKALVHVVVDIYPDYFDSSKEETIMSQISQEVRKFRKTIENGLKLIEKVSPFDLYQSYGFPPEVTEEIYKKRGLSFDKKLLEEQLKKHQELSRSASQGKFKGGLADHSEQVTKYHTATHLLQAALRKVLGDHVHQEGSNLTAERLRFDFSHPQKLTPEEIGKIETLVNSYIKKDLVKSTETISYKEAIESGALAFFKERYPERVTVYTFRDPSTNSGFVSREICGGPHVEHTGILGKFKIIKEEAVAAGARRIYATLI